MKYFLLRNVKMPTIVGILTLMSRKIAFWAYLSLNNAVCFLIHVCFLTYEYLKLNILYNLGAWSADFGKFVLLDYSRSIIEQVWGISFIWFSSYHSLMNCHVSYKGIAIVYQQVRYRIKSKTVSKSSWS